ncbi:SPOR domain-containing protein [Aliiroseovarius sp. PrR006]|uniref:SPOR domain-containing protein n=1 Tax=Aliiroseovarius sp. PrR006 TaxID=2706883 RepID=UPI0013D80060|nr:SPOR domain-containing protein [Aliiroseovarius sp. PrR006]NDW53460.1 SPOR domain-containing protein [Aliiroseovarius sp. PrR006]
MSIKTTVKVAMALGGALLVAACDDTNLPGFMKNANSGERNAQTTARQGEVIERDVEAPEVFQVTEKGLWDGRPSLGGVWVAHPSAKDPERVIIRNPANGKSAVAALFRREREIPGPRLQVSSEAAAELGILAGAPTELSVTALRKQKVPVAPPPVEDPVLEDPAEISQSTLDDPIAAAEAALDRTEKTTPRVGTRPAPKPTAKPAATKPVAAAKPAAPAPAGTPSKPFIQIGIFSVEQNAKNAAESLRGIGIIPTIKPGNSNGKKFWRVVAGPATNKAELEAVLNKIKGLGFVDAYAVTN